MSTRTKFLKKMVSQYEFSVIKNQIADKKIQNNPILPSFSKKNFTFKKMKNMFSYWTLDERISIIHNSLPYSTNTNKNQVHNSYTTTTDTNKFIWVGNDNMSFVYALLYLTLENIKSIRSNKISSDKKVLLKYYLYKLAESTLQKQEIQIFVQGLCLLQYYQSSLSQFFFKHQPFQKACLKLFLKHSSSTSKGFQQLASIIYNINQKFSNDLHKLKSSISQFIACQVIYEDDDFLSDQIIKISILGQMPSFIISEKENIFIYQYKNEQNLQNMEKICKTRPTTKLNQFMQQSSQTQLQSLFKGFKADSIGQSSTIFQTQNQTCQNSKLQFGYKIIKQAQNKDQPLLKLPQLNQHLKKRLETDVESIYCSHDEQSELDIKWNMAQENRKNDMNQLQSLINLKFKNNMPKAIKRVPQFLLKDKKPNQDVYIQDNKKKRYPSKNGINKIRSQNSIQYIPYKIHKLQRYSSQSSSPFQSPPLNSPRRNKITIKQIS